MQQSAGNDVSDNDVQLIQKKIKAICFRNFKKGGIYLSAFLNIFDPFITHGDKKFMHKNVGLVRDLNPGPLSP